MLICVLYVVLVTTGSAWADYWSDRAQFVDAEVNMALGGSVQLNNREKTVNGSMMVYKLKEYDQGFSNPSRFPPAVHFFKSKPWIEASQVFQFIRKMPKGAVLHAHDTALVSQEYLYNITFTSGLYACINADNKLLLDFRQRSDPSCQWELLSVLRANSKNPQEFEKYIQGQLSLVVEDPIQAYPNINVVWDKFRDLFGTVTNLITYRPVFEDYFYQVLKELYEDNIMYLEFRGTLPTVYEVNGTEYGPVEVVGIYKRINDLFVKENPGFHGSRFIYAPWRMVNHTIMDTYVETVLNLKKTYPDYFAGFDLVGQEDLGERSEYFVQQILKLPNNIRFFFHCGETMWNGMTDMNLVDAVLLQTDRIGHGYALLKHPRALQIVKEKGIAVEVSPISNQVLTLVQDLRNHPAIFLISNNYPVVISNDDPTFWGSKGLSYDYYEAFMGFGSRQADLRFLKQISMNSIKYSAMPADEKGIALTKFEKSWEEFITNNLYSLEYYNLVEPPVLCNGNQ